MASLAHFQNHLVEVLDTYECAGELLASVKCLDGDIFVAGLTYPIRTRYGIVKASELIGGLTVSLPAPAVLAVTL